MRTFALAVALLVIAGGAAWSADSTDPEPTSGDATKMLGDWELAGIQARGKGIDLPLPVDQLKMVLTFQKGGKLSGSTMGQQQKGTWKIDPKKSPRHLDMNMGGGGGAGVGIYKIEKGQLLIGANQAQNNRPKDFDSADMTMTFTRKKK